MDKSINSYFLHITKSQGNVFSPYEPINSLKVNSKSFYYGLFITSFIYSAIYTVAIQSVLSDEQASKFTEPYLIQHRHKCWLCNHFLVTWGKVAFNFPCFRFFIQKGWNILKELFWGLNDAPSRYAVNVSSLSYAQNPLLETVPCPLSSWPHWRWAKDLCLP